MANTYDVGDNPRLLVVCAVSGTPTDPTTLTLRVKKPDGTTTSYTWAGAQVVKDSTGNFHYDLAIDQAGQWFYDWTATGTAAGSEAGEFAVRYRRAA